MMLCFRPPTLDSKLQIHRADTVRSALWEHGRLESSIVRVQAGPGAWSLERGAVCM
jgi:hypothetical protein